MKDPSGGVVPNAEVSVTEIQTNVRHSTKTDSLGTYAFLALPVGTYRLTVKASGFQTHEQTGIMLDANDVLRLDMVLQVGSLKQTIEVSTTAARVETANTQIGDVIGSGKMEALPLNGRNYTDLLGLQPGVVPVSAGTVSSGSEETGNVSISGQREAGNGFVVNGGNVEENLANSAGIIPNLDSIEEFRVLTSNADAEYGYYAGGLVNVVTKSGTNAWHGDLFEFLRNQELDARNFYDYNQTNPYTGNEIPGSARGLFQQNQFGGTFGGRLIRDKVFFFSDYQGTRTIRGLSTGLVPVPSGAMRDGNFSEVADSLGGGVDGPFFANYLGGKLGYPVSSGEPYYTTGCTSTANCVFPNAQIPTSVFAAPALAIMKYIPQANAPGSNFVSSADDQRTRDDLGSVRLDFNTRFGMISGYYFLADYITGTAFGANNVPGFPSANNGRSQQYNLGWTENIGAAAVNELRFNYTRLVAFSGRPTANIGTGVQAQAGFSQNVPGAMLPGAPAWEGLPALWFNNFSLGPSPVFFENYTNNPELLDNFSLMHGHHTLKFGGEYMLSRLVERFPLSYGNGLMEFIGTETGNGFADYLINAADEFVQESSFTLDERKDHLGLYGQDSWRVKPNLTLNYGVRWEYDPLWYERNNHKWTYALGQQSAVYPTAPAGVLYVGDNLPGFGKIPRTIAPTPLDRFAPRLGLAYSPSASGGVLGKLFGGAGKTSIRVSYGIYDTSIEGIQTFNSDPPLPFIVWYVSPTGPFFDRPYMNRTDGAVHPNPFPFVPPQPGTPVDFAPLLPISGYSAINVRDVPPYAEHYSLSLERQLGPSTLLTLAYVGAEAHHLIATVPINPGVPALCMQLSNPANVMPGTPTCGPYGEDATYTRPDGTVVYGTRAPFGEPNFADNTYGATVANSDYNSMQISVRHTTGRLNFLAGYTWSKSMDDSSAFNSEPINPSNAAWSRSLSAFDSTNNFVTSYNYLLPFDRLFANRLPRLTQGWRLVGITRFATGFPVSMYDNSDNSLLGTFGSGVGPGLDTPDFTGGRVGRIHDPRSGLPYFDTSLFSVETLGQLGNANRRFFHGPGLNNWDIALLKDIKLRERLTLQFRAEFFNAFNHAQFNNPDGQIGDYSTFGLVTSARDPRIGQFALKAEF